MGRASIAPLVGKQVAEERVQHEELRPGTVALVHTTSDVVFGRTVLLASESGRYIDAAGVVIGQTVRKKHAKNTREVFVTDRFPQQTVPNRERLTLAARVATARELSDYQEALLANRKSLYAFVRIGAERAAEDLGPAQQTKETRCARILVECAKARGLAGKTEVQVKASPSSAKTGSRPARADAVIRLRPRGRRERIMVIETEWSKPGGAESAAQAWEYAARMKYEGGVVGDRHEPEIALNDFATAEILPCVVANDVPDISIVGDELGIPRMHYVEFLRMLQRGSFNTLTPLQRTRRRRTWRERTRR